jgi:hypothetical protein
MTGPGYAPAGEIFSEVIGGRLKMVKQMAGCIIRVNLCEHDSETAFGPGRLASVQCEALDK